MDCKVVQNYVITPVVLGQGCFGTVYRGYMKNNKNELLAVKAIPLDKIKNEDLIRRQIQILLKLNSPNIVKFYKPAKTKTNLYFFLEFCQTDLKIYVKNKGGILSQVEVINILRQICNGFQQVHKQNIIHRDIKPANFLMHKGVVKIADFGFARVVDTVDEEGTLTWLGSPLYMAPQILGKQKFSSKCDVWSLGVTIYEILYGKPPYTAKNPPQLLENIKTKPLQFPADIKRSDDIKDLLKRMLTIDEEQRISWTQLFQHPVIKPTQTKIEPSGDSLVQSFRQNEAYMKKNKIIGNTDIELQSEATQQLAKTGQNKGGQNFDLDFKEQQQKLKQYSKIQQIDEMMRYKRNVSVFLNVQCNNFFNAGSGKLPDLLFYMGLFILLRHQITIHQQLHHSLTEGKAHDNLPQDVWINYIKSANHSRILKLIECDMKHLSAYFKEVDNRIKKTIKNNKGIELEVVNEFESNFLKTEKFSLESYKIIMKAIMTQLKKNGVDDANLYIKLKISTNPFVYLKQDIDFGLFYEQEEDHLKKILKQFPDLKQT